MARAIIGPAHGTAAEGAAELVAETVRLKDLPAPNADRTVDGLAFATRRGRPFQIGNTAAANRGSSLTRVTADPGASEEHRRARRKAASLAAQRRRELEVQTGGPVSSAVRVELVAWASGTAWADLFERAGDALAAADLRKKASVHGLKALGLAEREADARPPQHIDVHAALAEGLADDEDDEDDGVEGAPRARVAP